MPNAHDAASRKSLLALPIVLLAACSNERAARTEPLPSPAAAAEAVVDDTATAAPRAPETERPLHARDPFADVEMALALSLDVDDEKDPLARVPLDRVRVRGVVLQATPLALVEDRDGKGHVVRLGDALGDRGGRVRRITGDGVVVEEIVRVWNGEVSRVAHVLAVGG